MGRIRMRIVKQSGNSPFVGKISLDFIAVRSSYAFDANDFSHLTNRTVSRVAAGENTNVPVASQSRCMNNVAVVSDAIQPI